MRFTNQQTVKVKDWLTTTLEDISDVDSDVLADYVLALLKTDAPVEKIRKEALLNLQEFTREHTDRFVGDLFTQFEGRPVFNVRVEAPPTFIASVPVANRANVRNSKLAGSNTSRKRSHDETEDKSNDARRNGSDEQLAQRARRGLHDARSFTRGHITAPVMPPMSTFPHPVSGFNQYPQNNLVEPMVAHSDMQARFPHLANVMKSQASMQTLQKGHSMLTGQRCRDFDTKGICVLGRFCPYDHTIWPVTMAARNEYDPKTATLDWDIGLRNQSKQCFGRPGKQAAYQKDWGGDKARYSDDGAPVDESMTSIMVEKLPREQLDKERLRAIFQDFGRIEEIDLQPVNNLAIIRFNTHQAARHAWQGSKATMYRPMKVYWHAPLPKQKGSDCRAPVLQSMPDTTQPVEKPKLDLEAIRQLQAERQKAFKYRMQRLKAMEDARTDLARRTEEILQRHERDKAALIMKLAGKESRPAADTENKVESQKQVGNVSGKAQALREHLAKLEQEAKSMGIDPDAMSEAPTPTDISGSAYPGRVHGSRRGTRGAFCGRGRGKPPNAFGGSSNLTWYANGSHESLSFARGRSPAVFKLDNRPRHVALQGVAKPFDDNSEEMLLAYLAQCCEFESIEMDTEDSNQCLVRFRERWQAEKLMAGTRDIPGVELVAMKWVAGPRLTMTTTTLQQTGLKVEDCVVEDDGDAIMRDVANLLKGSDDGQEQEVNLDVAGENDWDLIS